MFAVIESGGKQHTVSEGDSLKVELISAEEGSTLEFDKVLMISDGKESKIGSPYLDNAKVTATLVSHGKHDKIKVFKMKRRKDYRRTYGHKQNYSQVQIESISL
ncbi:MAG: 50S ribosomal protein L21 [Gammaproteobacteria bacterium]|jgi:large subunit ribosomal protein L21|nr:50S ribosomal protein L21 [Gammaproteobacteria bacterium]HJL96419.1 50S ribosomal protein L21 [SAR86 cluster bacterium]HJM59767.1 50S ribosomal protein L21 [SAR86 cluster bacterium]|tara:strand:+ start:36293 stop:36604 length:312 start_codon:yes stop_codon:yes gene_type:complete